MKEGENLLRAWRFQKPERIPMRMTIPSSAWRRYGHELETLMLRHPILFPDFKKGSIDYGNLPVDPRNRAGNAFTDAWGCVYEPAQDDVPCYVSKHPLASWDAFESFSAPDPETQDRFGPRDWLSLEEAMQESKINDKCPSGSLIHGHLFLLLEDMIGYEHLILDMVDENPNLPKLIAMIEDYSMAVVHRFLSMGVEVMHYPEDLGAQDRPLLSPKLFRKYIKPAYTRLMAPAKENGILVYMHSDGYLWDLMDDILACGVDVINPQDLVNGVDNMAKRLKGRVAIDLDVDRQRVTSFGSAQDIDDLIHEEVAKLGSQEGGLSLKHGLYSGAPPENIDALMTAMEKYSTYFSR